MVASAFARELIIYPAKGKSNKPGEKDKFERYYRELANPALSG